MSKIKAKLEDCPACYEFGVDPTCHACDGTGFVWASAQLRNCGHCGRNLSHRGWHGCPQSMAAKAMLTGIVDSLHQMMAKPGSQSLTSVQMAEREERRQSIATSIELNGGQVRLEYQL